VNTACSAADRYVSVLHTPERGASCHNRQHLSRDQLHVHGLQQRIVAHTGCHDRLHLFTGPQSTGGPSIPVLVIKLRINTNIHDADKQT